MSNFTDQDLSDLENLCRIKLNKEEKENFVPNIKKILDYMEQLNEIDTKDTAPCNYVLKSMQYNITRDDVVESHLNREKFLENSPENIGGMIKVFPIIKQ